MAAFNVARAWKTGLAFLTSAVVAAATSATLAQTRSDAPRDYPYIDAEGAVHYAPALTIPFSRLASDEARSAFAKSQSNYPPGFFSGDPFGPERVQSTRKWFDDWAKVRVERMRRQYPVTVTREIIGGVQTDVVTPAAGVSEANAKRVLINMHGGSFVFGAQWIGLLESIPVSSVGKFKVVTIDYRMAPEHQFPAASEDVAAVYAELLKTYRPENIGIYGCSAGGRLTMQSVAWFQVHDLPRPGAAGVFCLGGLSKGPGDSGSAGYILSGRRIPQADPVAAARRRRYAGAAAVNNPLATPADSRDILAKFPPTLLISGTRDFALSDVVATHSRLVAAGVDADLHVWEGMTHAFFYDPDTPEAKEVYAVATRFFDRTLAK